ncbi:U11/U12 small nuclear ribonucleoprotein [Liparis tanakae]|uniref:U11/U12 small nuclear ribonucleoprotein n=1 Tax=Liparis tanakae TaxID=230148 RepID=A0A4Z2GJ97_9TELE|nr:U11/U12 small nuclear ribonucleoprotein [Liparis tanakae]
MEQCPYDANHRVPPKTHLELMAEMRDYKRRRQSYRAKNVHITKKSYTEAASGGEAPGVAGASPRTRPTAPRAEPGEREQEEEEEEREVCLTL